MNPLLGLTEYLRKLERSFRLLAYSRGAALIGGAALIFTVILVVIANAFAFSDPSVFWSRVVLFIAIAVALGIGLVVPLMRLNRRWTARQAEKKIPGLQERLLTFTEKSQQNADDPFLPLLAADAMEVVDKAGPEPIVPQKWIVSFASAAAVAVTVLLWLGISGPGFLGYGTALLWGTVPKDARALLYTIKVQPGTKLIRRRSDQIVTATISGFTTSKVSVFAKYASSAKWEEAPMEPRAGSSSYDFDFASVPENVEYYVSAGGLKSETYKLTVVDLPGVKKIRVTYHYPSVYGLKNETEDPGGDLRAVEGTEAELEITTDKPLSKASIVLDSGTKIDLESKDGKLFGRVPIVKDDMYHIATPEQGEMVRLTEDYFIEARKDSAPVVTVLKPGRDAKVSPIEEVAVHIQGKDDFGLNALDLHYSVNGAPEKIVSLLGTKGAKEADGSTTVYLEDYKLQPGDIISYYATAKDARTTSKTDIYFIEAQPFEKEYSQSQQAGGGGGGGGQQDQDDKISQREKEVIAATWNQLKAKDNKATAADNAKYLADVQGKLRDQAQSLANRMKARELSENNPAFKAFTEDMEKAVEAMGPASDKLKGQKWDDALAPEQKALQYLLRAESTFRQIQVAFGQKGGGGGGGGGGGASRDLENLFDLELDTEKNQYEAAQQSQQEKQQKAIDDALDKLKELAKRQEELAQQQKNQNQFQQRWQQEMLRRDAEELRRQMEQLARNQQQQQGQQGQQGQQSQQSSSQSGQQGQQGQQSSSQSGQQGQQQSQQGGAQSGQSSSARQQQNQQQRGGMQGTQQRQLEEALSRLGEATRDMSQAASAAQQQGQQGQQQSGQGQSQAQAQANARKAAQSLQEARDMLNGMRQQQTGDQMQDIAKQTDKLAEEQQNFEQRMKKNFGGEQGDDNAQARRQMANQMADEKEKMEGEYQDLERQMQNTARSLTGTQPEASKKLRDAIGNLQQEEIKTRMQASADMLRRGMGAYAIMREAPITQGLNQLKDDVRNAQQAMGKGGDKQNQAEQALAQADKLKQDMERLAQQAQQQNGQGQRGGQQQGKGQQGGQQQGQQGQQGQQAGPQPGQGQQGGQQAGGQQGGQQQGGNQPGEMTTAGGPGGSAGPNGGAWNDAVRDFNRLQNQLRDNPELSRQLRDLYGRFLGTDPRRFQADPKVLEQRINDFLGDMEGIELALRKNVDGAGGNPRTATPQQVPPGYANAVAEYFRRLSKQ